MGGWPADGVAGVGAEARGAKIGGDRRRGSPARAGGDPVERVRRLWSQRAALYSLADFTVHTDSLSPEDIATEVVRLYELYGERTLARDGRIEALRATPAGLPPVTDAPGAATIVRTA
jgi:hypothetical protein